MSPASPRLRRCPLAGASPLPKRYHERELKSERPPLDLAVAIVRALGGTRYTLHETGDRILVGIGAVWTLTVDENGIVRCDGVPQPAQGDLGRTLTDAMGKVPFQGWRAYGRVSFEFAGGTRADRSSAPAGALLTLAIPAMEICLHGGSVLLRCFDGRRLMQVTRLIDDLECRPDLLPASAPVAAPDCPDSAERYTARVAAAVAEMRAQDYDKVVLSRIVPLPESVDLPLSFHAGRAQNTPMRAFLLRDGDDEAYGFSPEMLLEVDAQGGVGTQPVAGTRLLTGDPDEDRRLREDLLRDPKEIVEHAVSVRLAMDEMRPLCAPGRLRIDQFMEVCARGSVQHLASRIGGRLRDGVGAWDVLVALFPAVTVSGVPKRATLDAIRRHEPPRGLYGGCVFTIDASGAMDAAVVLRSVFRQGKTCWCQAGAGILPMSVPARELEETREKVASVTRHLRQATGAPIAAPSPVLLSNCTSCKSV